ncbi:hypothetical protein FOG48_01401 [Hanseniaspora uvarum]|nr:hypothetical protein FOG48_01401 [Hanseniaspora uvarum]
MSEYASFQEIIGNNPHIINNDNLFIIQSYKYFNDKLLQLVANNVPTNSVSEPQTSVFKSNFVSKPPSFNSPKTSSRDRNSSVFKINYNMDRPGWNSKKEEDVDPAASSQPNQGFRQDSDVMMDNVHPPNFNVNRRTSVSAEIISPDSHMIKESFNNSNNTNALSDHESESLIKCLDSNFLFKNLDPNSKNLIINNLKYDEFPTNTDIIVENDEEGEYFYIIEQGEVEFIKNGKKLGEAGRGATFGELALMYNSPRQATVRSKTPCKMYLLDRITFKKILLNNSYSQRSLFEKFLKKLPILKNLTDSERNKLIDVLKSKTVSKDQIIIRQGEIGENFYIIEQGDCAVIKDGEQVNLLHQNDYFGELSLLEDSPRAATVKVISENGCKVVYLGKSEFKRLLGPVHEVLKINDPRIKH